MGPGDFFQTLETKHPRLTVAQAAVDVNNGSCEKLHATFVVAQVAPTVYGDVENAAKDIDAVLTEMNATSYAVDLFVWLKLENRYATQLRVDFSPLRCGGETPPTVVLDRPTCGRGTVLRGNECVALQQGPTDAQIRRTIIESSLRSYSGNCPCPYNRASNGSR